jgi:4-amino-4-deoxy-L-arabinose transferase-like glycosyltransferase
MTIPSQTTLEPPAHRSLPRRADPRSIGWIVLVWIVLHVGGLFSPGLLDDVDSIYLEIARQMLRRHDFVTPYIDGIRFFDKPPLMYWLAAGCMRVFGEHDWAGRLPLALLTLALLLATYALGLRLFAAMSPAAHPDRGALYAALALATCIGPYLYTRFYIPDIVVTLWIALAIHLFLIALERIDPASHAQQRSALWPCLGFAAVTALNLLTKGFIGLVFPLGFVFLYLAFTRKLNLLPRFHIIPSTLLFLAIALPWHVLAAIRNPAIAMPAGLGLPAHAGWAWFYLYNEHIARFLSRRIPHDYGQVPIPLFWLLAAIWMFPWTAFLPGALRRHTEALRDKMSGSQEAAITLLLWAGLILGFFTLSARQEYYSLPALPAFALMAGGLLAEADANPSSDAASSALLWHKWLLTPICTVCTVVALFFAATAPAPPPNLDIAALLSQGDGAYNLSLSHIFDLTGRAMGFFRGPLLFVGLSMLVIGPGAFMLRRSGRTLAANLSIAAASICLLLCVHAGLVRFYPTLGSKDLAKAIVMRQQLEPRANDVIAIDGELTAGSTLIFYTHESAHLINGHINGPWFGSFWPDSPAIFENDESLHRLWRGPTRIFLLTYHANQRSSELSHFGPVNVLASSGGKSLLTNR